VAQVIVTPRARRDVDDAISKLSLPADTWSRIVRSLRVLETFPLSGPELAGRWGPARFILGPWSWMVLLYSYDETSNRVFILSMYDARAAASPRFSGG
jgi:plasmid stabilization system protein ParE